jgi:translation elongation factor EF-Tu-like GTPase
MINNSQLRATIRFLTPEEGGRITPTFSGIKPNLKVNDIFTSSFVWGDHVNQLFNPGSSCSVLLELPMWEEYRESIHVGMPVELNEGSRVIATGTIEKILVE